MGQTAVSDTSWTPEGAFSSEGRKAQAAPSPPPEEPAPAIASVETPRWQSLWQRHRTRVLVAAVVATFVACAISIAVQVAFLRSGGRDGRFVQEGKVMVPLEGEHEVFNAVPFGIPPNLVLEGGSVNWNAIKLKEQKADRFTIQCTANMGFAPEVQWRAEGIRGAK
jgi:hypothetical protein